MWSNVFRNGSDNKTLLPYLKINISVFVHVEGSEYVIAEFLRITRWEEHLVHVYEFGRC